MSLCLFLFAHQDDEFGVFAAIEDARAQGMRPVCLYLTDGAANAPAARREAESRAVLQSLGVASDDIFFVGRKVGSPDGALFQTMDRVYDAARAALALRPPPDRVYVHAWEGGHQDHDAAHCLSLALALDWPKAELRQFSLYHGAGMPRGLFKVRAPLPENGPVESSPVPWKRRFRHLRLCWAYPSQTKTFIGLFPFILWHTLRGGRQEWQTVPHPAQTPPKALLDQPHLGLLLYEGRKVCRWSTVHAALLPFVEKHFSIRPAAENSPT